MTWVGAPGLSTATAAEEGGSVTWGARRPGLRVILALKARVLCGKQDRDRAGRREVRHVCTELGKESGTEKRGDTAPHALPTAPKWAPDPTTASQAGPTYCPISPHSLQNLLTASGAE